ncbi:MAG: hypothetical protein HQ521_06420 [Bacteroidetes bacterium]|nr:hypothetical protein [Bacteroidota bacterium]
MNKRLKIFLLFITTLLIGIIIGFLISGRMISHRIEKMNNYYSETGFGREIMRVIKPTEEQREQIIPILKKHAGLNSELMGDYHAEQRELFLKLKEELQEILNDDQINRLTHNWENRRLRYNKNKMQHGQRNGKGRMRQESP